MRPLAALAPGNRPTRLTQFIGVDFTQSIGNEHCDGAKACCES
jgi:hypothetical protein